jgi:hypothetical protein
MSLEEQLELLTVDLKVIRKAKEISNHLSRIYDSQDSPRPISEWRWHLDKIAKGEILIEGFKIIHKENNTS